MSESGGVLRSGIAWIRSRRSTGRALATTLIGGVGVQLTLLVTGVALARALGPENRGYMALLILVTAIAWQFGGLGVPLALTYAIARAPTAAERIVSSVRGAITMQVALATLVAGLALALLTANKPGYVQLGALMTVAAVAPGVYQRCGLGVLQGLREFTTFNLWRVAPNALFAVVTVVFLVAGVTDFMPYAAAWAVSRSIFVLATQPAARRAANRSETGAGEPPPKTALLKFGRKGMFGGAPPVETYRLDQAVVALFLAPVALGYYVAALAFTNLPRFIAQSFGLVANPAVAHQPTHEAARRSMWRFFWISVPFYLGVIIPLWVTAPFLARFFFGSEFAQAGGISRILLIATALFCARRVLADAARGAGYPGLGSIAEVFSLVSVVPLFATFVPIWGVHGVAYALVLSSAIALAILVIPLLRAGSTGKVPSAWLEIHADTIRREPVAAGKAAA
jgi:O-antigen/teichoic acid export membrane protein